MSIYYSGTFQRSGGIVSAITKQLKQVNLKPVKKIQVQFDPFHPQAKTARDFLFYITTARVTETNWNCPIKTNIVCDRSDPWIKVDLLNSENSVKFLADNLSVLEILQYFNKHISSLVEPEDPLSTNVQETKQEKKKKKKRK